MTYGTPPSLYHSQNGIEKLDGFLLANDGRRVRHRRRAGYGSIKTAWLIVRQDGFHCGSTIATRRMLAGLVRVLPRQREPICGDMRFERLPAGFVIPAQPVVASRPPTGPDWVHEIKHDGYRLIVRRDGPTVRLYSRNG